ncbi:unnamed protein product [Clonostachys rosea f. rosea IK726]|uniref:Uncharacterized protein n=2 Tax=Bionectria ochroleuca TaxID=29856 RepID=A0A0B7JTU0_BIOOC|nr:unnamed protein product [Clonostachys rosea f. rosea IK726]
MCLPCFQWAWARYEDPLDAVSELPDHAVWVPTGNNCWALQRTVAPPPSLSPFFYLFLHHSLLFNPNNTSSLSALFFFLSSHPQEMPDPGAGHKSPKTPRRVKTPSADPSSRHVHFQTTTAGETAQAAAKLNNLQANIADNKAPAPATEAAATPTQPTSFPALVPPSSLGPGQWFTSTNASQSVSFPQQQQQAQNATVQVALTPNLTSNLTQHADLAHTHLQPVTYIYPPTQQSYLVQQKTTAMAADYQNTCPPPMGLNFQPPVPDTSMGPMNHLYVPRFDGGVVPVGNVAVRYPSSSFMNCAPVNTTMLANVPMPQQYPMSRPYYYYAVNSVPVQQPTYVVQPQTGYVQQPVMLNGQPMMTAGPQVQQAFIPAGQAVIGGQPPIIAGNPVPAPEFPGLGRTQGEEILRQNQFAHQNRLFEPQDFKPADDDPSRFYYVRELDGNWTQRNRFSIDHMGDCRWYVTDEGWFYAGFSRAKVAMLKRQYEFAN